MPSLPADATASTPQSQTPFRKRPLPDETTASDSKKLRLDESSPQARDKKDRKRRKTQRKRKASVVEAGSKSPSAPNSSTLETNGAPSASPSPAPKAPPPPDLPSTLLTTTIKSTSPDPGFVQGSSLSQGAWSPLRATSPSALPDMGKAVSPTPGPQESLSNLKESLTTTSESLRAHQALFSSLVSSITCQVCLDLLHKPFALAPCGHVTCYNCLVSWFNTPPPNDVVHELAIWRKKTCPHCRTVVRDRPVEVWAVKDMVVNVVKSGLATNFLPPIDPPNVPAVGGNAARDPWANIFPPVITARAHHHPDVNDQNAYGMFDAEDGVYRCIDCLHEIWEGSCAQCGRIYLGHDGDGSDDGSDPDHDIANIFHALNNGLVNGFLPHWHPPPLHDDDDGSLSGSEESYEDSFIDDEGDLGQHADPPDVIELSSDDDLGGHWRTDGPQAVIAEIADGEDEENVPPPRWRTDSPQIATPDTTDDEEDEDHPPRIRRVDGRASAITSDEESPDDTAEPRASGSGRRQRGPQRRTRAVTVIHSDEDEDERTGDDDASTQEVAFEEDDGSISRPPIRLAHLFRGERSPSPQRTGEFYPEYDHDEENLSGIPDRMPEEEMDGYVEAWARDAYSDDEDEYNYY